MPLAQDAVGSLNGTGRKISVATVIVAHKPELNLEDMAQVFSRHLRIPGTGGSYEYRYWGRG